MIEGKEQENKSKIEKKAKRKVRSKRKKTTVNAKMEKKIKKLKQQLKEKNDELAEYIDTLQRLQAEFENYKKRIVKEQSKFIYMANKDLIKKLLPIIDNFERVVSSKKNKDEVKKIIDGINIIYKEFGQILKKEGVKELYPKGEMFDPRYHDAIMQIESDKHEEGKVLEVLQKGYLLNDNLLRPATVKVSKKTEKSQ
jgi:molecular chaperone GrpE